MTCTPFGRLDDLLLHIRRSRTRGLEAADRRRLDRDQPQGAGLVSVLPNGRCIHPTIGSPRGRRARSDAAPAQARLCSRSTP